jgi:Transposase IS4
MTKNSAARSCCICCGFGQAIVCADSYFASVQAACHLFDLNFRFIGVLKTATKLFPKAYLGKVELPIRGTVAALTAVHDRVELLSFVYCDSDCHYFISTCSNVAGGDPIRCTRMRQLQPIETDKPPERVDIKMNCPQVAALYYSACGKIDWHNQCRQSGLELEKKIQTKSWHKRVNLSIFGMIVVDSYLLHRECTGGCYSQHVFYQLLIKDLLENGFAVDVETRSRLAEKAKKLTSLVSAGRSAGWGLHITPTKRTVEDSVSSAKKFRQSRCRPCDAKTIMVCSECRRDPEIGEIGAVFCNPLSGWMCYREHMDEWH